MSKEKALELLEVYLRDQGLNDASIKTCLDAIHLSLSWKPVWASKEELEGAGAIISYAFGIGKRKDGNPEEKDPSQIQYDPGIYHPGLTNVGLAEVISDLYEKGLEKPIFAQWEVATALEEMGIEAKSVAKPREGYLSTQGVIRQFIESSLTEHDNVILVVHPIHSYRARAITLTEIEKQSGKRFERILHADTSDVCCDPDSIQPWTRYEEDNVRYDIGARTQHVLYKNTLDVKFFKRGKQL